jgi:small-conductance mechanosensitive channel
VSKTPNTAQKLPFETLSELAEGKDGELMRDKVKALIRLFRPDRKGFLTKLDFITSVDQVYRELRLYRANLSNSQQIDTSFHGLINILHYFVVILIVLIIMGFNNWESLLSMTTFFFSFSFMFGPASSKYFEGILMIFVRRPYEIGDKVAISDPEVDTNASGSSTWFVEKVSLYSTTVRFATTNEVATYSNGSLARLRIINAKRSPKAIVYVYNKFGSDVPYRLIQVFKASVENFVKARPREWAQLNGFRATRVNLEFNFIEYVIVLTHRELWQNIGPILQSKADLASFSLEVSKKLNLRYEQPPKPIHLSLDERHYDLDRMSVDLDSASSGLQQVREMFKRDDHDE